MSSNRPLAAAAYDVAMQLLERTAFPGTRAWVGSRARGETLEVAIGTGANLPHYPAEVRLTGVDRSPAMLAFAARRAGQLRRVVDLMTADAMALPFPEASFETVVCTFALCEVPDDRAALAEFVRVLRPGGRLLLVDHVASNLAPVRVTQRLLDRVTVPVAGEHFTRRPAQWLAELGLQVLAGDRFALGTIERVHAQRR